MLSGPIANVDGLVVFKALLTSMAVKVIVAVLPGRPEMLTLFRLDGLCISLFMVFHR